MANDSSQVSPAVKLIAPAAAMGVAWVVRQGMSKAYEASTGNKPPSRDDRDVSIGRVIVWAVAVAAVAAAIDVVVVRLTNSATESIAAKSS